MKKVLILIILFVFGVFLNGNAQPASAWESGLPGIQQIITQYGDQLNLNDDQKAELVALIIDHRKDFQRQRIRTTRRGQHSIQHERSERLQQRDLRNKGVSPDSLRQREVKPRRERSAETDRSVRNRSSAVSRTDMYQQIHEVLTDEQSEILTSILIERANSQHDFRTLRYEEMISRAEIEGDKSARVKEIFEMQSRIRTDLMIQRVQNPGEMTRENMQAAFRDIREGNRELMGILTAAEYMKLHRQISPGSHRHLPSIRRSVFRSR